MPFLPLEMRPAHSVLIEQTVYENPDNIEDKLTLFVCKSCPLIQEHYIKEDLGNSVNLEAIIAALSFVKPEDL
jgi:hypothetical protein